MQGRDVSPGQFTVHFCLKQSGSEQLRRLLMTMLWLAAIAFVGTHFLLSHPLRAPMVRAMLGEGAFSGIFIPWSRPSRWVG